LGKLPTDTIHVKEHLDIYGHPGKLGKCKLLKFLKSLFYQKIQTPSLTPISSLIFGPGSRAAWPFGGPQTGKYREIKLKYLTKFCRSEVRQDSPAPGNNGRRRISLNSLR
jgi:hypothetical protein